MMQSIKIKKIRLFSKTIDDEKVQVAYGAQDQIVDKHDDLSTGETQQSPSTIECRKKSIKAIFLSLLLSIAHCACAMDVSYTAMENEIRRERQKALADNEILGQETYISNIYVEGTGNNKYEAKIKAIDSAARRALVILASEWQANVPELEEISYDELKNAIKTIEIKHEEFLGTKTQSYYRGWVKYNFRPIIINRLILDHASQTAQNLFFETAVIPIFKLNTHSSIIDGKDKWLKIWDKKRDIARAYRIYIPQSKDLQEKGVDAKNIMKLTYEDILESLPFKLYKRALIITAEYFTNRDNGNTYLRIKSKRIDDNGVTEDVQNFDMPDNLISNQTFISKIIGDTIVAYGKKPDKQMIESLPQDVVQIDPVADVNEKTVNMQIEFYSEDELDSIQKKLRNIKKFKTVTIQPDNNFGYAVKIVSNLSNDEFAETLYYNGLTYYENGKQLVLLQRVDE